MEGLLNILTNPDTHNVWVLNRRYCPDKTMAKDRAIVTYTDKWVDDASPFAWETIRDIAKYGNVKAFKKAYDIERIEKFHYGANDGSRINALLKFCNKVKKGDYILFVYACDIYGYYIVKGDHFECETGEGFCSHFWKADAILFNKPVNIKMSFGNPFFKEVTRYKDSIINALGGQVVKSSEHTTSMTYEKKQQIRQIKFRESITDKGFTYILADNEREKNLYNWQDKDYVQKIKSYFADNHIKWWTCYFDAPEGEKADGKHITRHLVSSQIACINHLFFIRHDKEAILSIINGIKDMPVKFKDILNIPCDKGDDNYISFEVTASKDYLHERTLTRGEYCTSIDALVYALDENNERWLIPIEWKYTETYPRDDKSLYGKGRTRLSRYCNVMADNLIGNSKQLKSLADYKGSIYFQEPFYQLMRQTLWAETICNSAIEEVIPAEHFVHIHVCPTANRELLGKHYADITEKTTMEEAWREMLVDQSLYHLVDPKDLMQPILSRYPDFYNYLKNRYWR